MAAACWGLQSEGTVAHIVSSSSPANCFTETLRGFKTARGLVGFGKTLLPAFLGFLPHSVSLLMPVNNVQRCRCISAISYVCVCVSLSCRCVLLSVKALWYPEWGSAAIYKLKGSSDLLAPHPAMFSDHFQTQKVWPAQTIKGMPTVILALLFHYGSAAAGGLISCVGLLRKWMGTDLAEMGAPGS